MLRASADLTEMIYKPYIFTNSCGLTPKLTGLGETSQPTGVHC